MTRTGAVTSPLRAPALRASARGSFLALALLAASCARELPGQPPPTDRPSFPTGLALHPEANALAVVSSNFDLGFSRGAVLLADLDRVDAALLAAPDPDSAAATVADAYTDAVLVPSFGNEPVFSSDGARLFVATRAENLLVELEVAADDGLAISCGGAASGGGDVPLCGLPPSALALSGNDPFRIALTGERADRVSGIVTSLLSDQVVFFDLRIEEEGAGFLQQADVLTLGGWLTDEEVIGVRGLALRPPSDGLPLLAFAVVERTDEARGRAADLIWFDATRGGRAQVQVLSLTDELGATSARELALTPAGDALLVTLRDPDGLARVDLGVDDGALAPEIAGVVSTCSEPVGVEIGSVPLDGDSRDRAFVTCFGDDTVLGYNPVTLDVTEASRFFGDGPYDVALDLDHAPPRAYVSYFLDDSVGVFDLVTDGAVGLTPRGRIGVPRPQPE